MAQNEAPSQGQIHRIPRGLGMTMPTLTPCEESFRRRPESRVFYPAMALAMCEARRQDLKYLLYGQLMRTARRLQHRQF